MRTGKAVVCAGLAGMLAFGIGVTAVAGVGKQRPRSAAAVADGEQVRAAQGSWCYSGERTAMCADYAYPLRIKRRLHVERGGRVVFRMHDATIGTLSASLLRVKGRRTRDRGELEDVERVPSNPRAWRATIPANAQNANVIDLFARYKANRGDSNWWAGIRLGD
jgi:hypothetical protein